MRALRFISVAIVSSAATAAGTVSAPAPAPRSSALLHGRTCEGAIANLKPGQPAKLQKLNELPPAEVYAAVYYTHGCPVRLVEAQGRGRR
jgi:hypothetical protein